MLATVAPSRSLVAIGQAAQLYDIPADLTGTIERGSFPATLLGASGTITVTVRDGCLAVDGSEAILEVVKRTEPVQPGDVLTLSRGHEPQGRTWAAVHAHRPVPGGSGPGWRVVIPCGYAARRA